MLVLARTLGESIILTNTQTKQKITIKVTKLDKTRVKLGIDAPENILIVRDDAKNIDIRTQKNKGG